MSEEIVKKIDDLVISDVSKDQTVNDEGTAPVILTKELTHYHPLNGKWSLWYTKPSVDKNESWADLLKLVVTFSTVEEFWGIYNAIPAASELPIRSDFHLFREGIKPEWEDPQNSLGGRWSHSFKEKKSTNINELWLRALLSAIGETLEDDNELNGIVLNVRKQFYRVGLWTKSCDKSKLQPIGNKFKKVLKLSDKEIVEFAPHDGGEGKVSKPLIVA